MGTLNSPDELVIHSADELALSPEYLQRQHEKFFSEMKPLTGWNRPPVLRTINGCGPRLLGNRDYDSISDTYVGTVWWVFFHIPIYPVAAYRLKYDGYNSQYEVFGRVPLSKGLKRYRIVPFTIFVLLMLWSISEIWPIFK